MLFAGPETALFAFPQVYKKWDSCKHRLLRNIKTDGWQMHKEMDLLQPEFGWKKLELKKLINRSNSFQLFVDQYFAKPLKRDHKQIWVEKTPANAYGFAAFLAHFSNGKVVQTIRNPYDAIASLMARGMNAFTATAYYVYHTAIATSCMEQERSFQLKYEELVLQPKAALRRLCAFLDIPFEPDIIIARHEKRTEPSTMSGWKHHETGAIKKSSIDRFLELPAEQKALIRAAFSTLEVSPFYRDKYGISLSSGADLCAALGYEYWEGDSSRHQLLLRRYYWRDRFIRIKHGFGKQFWTYPISL